VEGCAGGLDGAEVGVEALEFTHHTLDSLVGEAQTHNRADESMG